MNERLRELRKGLGVSQTEVAKAVGISASAYSNYEQGIREPSYEILKKLCEYYNVSADYLLGIEE
ncbi:MAG: helix-turn-helix transcriptional regulator [Clostridia bacterium]|nr:helix-turn-helix transcriptional regulator [Clostridia bacterium]MBQ8793002.1 helix-turn-helix transcriptional regulator [Clostridia bacterium]